MPEMTLLAEDKFMQNTYVLKATSNSAKVKIKDIWI